MPNKLRVVGIRRAQRFSPNSVERDAAICQAVADCLGRQGYDVSLHAEEAFTPSLAQGAAAVFSMARGTETVAALERLSTPVVNPVAGLRNARRGDMTRQGATSQLAAEYLASWLEKEGLKDAPLWDACCGRGGKTTALLEKSVHVAFASEPSSFRLEELKAAITRLALPRPRLFCGQAQEVEESFPLILLDVPCSGTGTLARNAELRLRLSPERLEEASRLQASILEHAWSRLLPGGALFYVTCALNRAENENRVEAFAREKGGRLVEEKMFLPAFPGQDTLFMAILRKDA